MHDKNGKPLKKGDIVLVKAKITDTYAADEYCNVQLLIGYEEQHGPHNVHGTVTVNSHQTVLLESGE